MTDKYAALRDAYHERIYAKSNVLDGQFTGACRMYGQMYGRYMPSYRGAAIVDIGCGAGQFLRYCINNGYVLALGIDLSAGQVRYAQQHVTPYVQLGDGLDYLSRHPNSFDLIVANDFIEHIPKDKGIEFVGLAKKALRPAGRLLMKTGNMAALGGLVIWTSGLDHETGYTERSLRALLDMWEFEAIEIIPYYAGSAANKCLHKTAHAVMRLLYRYLYAGNYPRVYTKLIGVTGVKP